LVLMFDTQLFANSDDFRKREVLYSPSTQELNMVVLVNHSRLRWHIKTDQEIYIEALAN
jgi:hypothetical protein